MRSTVEPSPMTVSLAEKIPIRAGALKKKQLHFPKNSVLLSLLCCIMPFPKHIPVLALQDTGFYRLFLPCSCGQNFSMIQPERKRNFCAVSKHGFPDTPSFLHWCRAILLFSTKIHATNGISPGRTHGRQNWNRQKAFLSYLNPPK